MHIVTRYICYLKDNPERYWFKHKVYGWGWTPATWQGWLTLIIFVILLVLNFERLERLSHSGLDTLLNVDPVTIGLVAMLLAICYLTGEKPHWQWGLPRDTASKLPGDDLPTQVDKK